MNEFYEQIESWLDGDLEAAELTAFENALSQDADLKKRVSQHGEMRERLAGFQIQEKVRTALNGQKTAARIVPIYRRPAVLAIAASIAAVLTAVWFFSQPDAPVSGPIAGQNQSIESPTQNGGTTHLPPEKSATPNLPAVPKPEKAAPKNNPKYLALAHEFQVKTELSSIREAAENSPEKSIARQAADFYESGNDRAVLQLLTDEVVANDNGLRFLRGHLRFKQGQFNAAARDFDRLQASFQFKQEARWNLLLCHLALGKINESPAREWLADMVADADFTFHQKAVELKARL